MQKRRLSLKESPQSDLVKRCREGGVTLVLGSGISAQRGLPSWEGLAQHLWQAAFPKRSSPWAQDAGTKSPREVPQFLPIVFELARRKLGEKQFVDVLRAKLYESAQFPVRDPNFRQSLESLAVLGRLVVQEFKRGGRRRIEAIVTLNADDLLEQAVFVLLGNQRWGGNVVRSYARSTGRRLGMAGLRPIPIYHIHGFVPANIEGLYGKWPWRFPRFFDHNLVFTDLQYWSTAASPLTFANRVVSWMLSETRCMFVGLSMTDINLLRWLALRTLELQGDTEQVECFAKTRLLQDMGLSSSWHLWIRPANDDRTGFLSEFLALRGIQSLEIKDWAGAGFSRLIAQCFPAS